MEGTEELPSSSISPCFGGEWTAHSGGRGGEAAEAHGCQGKAGEKQEEEEEEEERLGSPISPQETRQAAWRVPGRKHARWMGVFPWAHMKHVI